MARLVIAAESGLLAMCRGWSAQRVSIYTALLRQLQVDVAWAEIHGQLAEARTLIVKLPRPQPQRNSITAYVKPSDGNVLVLVQAVTFAKGDGWKPDGPRGGNPPPDIEILADLELSGAGRAWQLTDLNGDTFAVPGPHNALYLAGEPAGQGDLLETLMAVLVAAVENDNWNDPNRNCEERNYYLERNCESSNEGWCAFDVSGSISPECSMLDRGVRRVKSDVESIFATMKFTEAALFEEARWFEAQVVCDFGVLPMLYACRSNAKAQQTQRKSSVFASRLLAGKLVKQLPQKTPHN